MLLAVLCATVACVVAIPSSTITNILDYRDHPTTYGPDRVNAPISVFRNNTINNETLVNPFKNVTLFINANKNPSQTIESAAVSKVNNTNEINNSTIQQSVSGILSKEKHHNHSINSSERTEVISPIEGNATAEDIRQYIIFKNNGSDDVRKTLTIPKFGFLKLNETGMRPEHNNFRHNLSEALSNLVPAMTNRTERLLNNMLNESISKSERNWDILKLREAIKGNASEVVSSISASDLKRKIEQILKSEPTTSNVIQNNISLSKIERALEYSTYKEAINSISGTNRSSNVNNVKGYNTYTDGNSLHVNEAPSGVQMVEESPAYASSVVLASDILSLSSAVAEVKDNVCREQGYRFLDGLLVNKRWALKMFDASAKSPQGLLFGSSYHLGNFDECIAIEEEISTTYRPIVGKYCLATIEWPQSEAIKKQRSGRGGELRWAVCVPDACDAEAVRQFVLDVLFRTVGNTSRVLVDNKDCYTRQPLVANSLDDAFLGLIIFFSLLIITCTSLDIWWGRKSKRLSLMQELAVSFSANKNIRKLLSTKQPNGFGLDCIAGIKTLAMVFIVAGHACLFIASGPVMDAEAWDRLLRQPVNSFMLNNTLLVDTFLMLSAFLFCRILLLELDKRRGRLNIIPVYIFRYIRVTPAYLVVILFYMTWLPKSGEGPLWKDTLQLEQERCSANWWANILYVNNYVNTDSLCMFQSWYLSVDTQLFFLAPAFIYPLWRWRRVGPAMLAVATLISALIPGVFTYEDQLDPTLMVYAKEFKDISQNKFFKGAYIKTHMKMTPYFMGLWFGYILHRVQANNFIFSTAFKATAWAVSVVLGTSVVFSISLFYQEWYTYSLIDSVSYASLHKLAWGLANGWLIIACATGNGGILGKLLTWKFLVPISRLTFCAYLVNGIVELYFIGTLRHPLHISFFNVFAIAVAHILLTFILATVLCLVFESPIHGIEKILLRTVGRPRESTEKVSSVEENSSTRSTCTSQPKVEA